MMKQIFSSYIYIATVIMALICVAGPAAYADDYEEPNFFAAINDVPIKDGLIELNDQTLTFDKPQGRIVETIAEIEDGTTEETRLYYKHSLPQLGWQEIEDNIYVRDDEKLTLVFENHESKSFLRLMLEPR